MVEDALKALSAAEAPPTRDRLFEIAVLARIERRRFHRTQVRNAALALGVGVILALARPSLDRLWPAQLPLHAFLPAGLTLPHILPSAINTNLALGMVLAAACLFLPWWRLRD